MSDSIVIVVQVFDETSDVDYAQCGFPFVVGQKLNEDGEIIARFYDKEFIISPLTGAKCKVKALPASRFTASATSVAVEETLGRVAGYAVDINVPACLIGRNHQLVNGVPRAAETGFEFLRLHAARRGCTPYGLEQFLLKNVRLKSVTLTFLFVFNSPTEAVEHLRELRNHAEGILNYVLHPPGSRNGTGKAPCYPVGPDNCFTLYIKERQFKVRAYIKQPNVPDAFASFPSDKVEQELVAQALKTVRVEVTLHESWLKANELDDPEAWRNNPAAYRKAFNLVRDTLRLDEGLRVRAPSEDTIAKLPPDHQTAIRAHLAGENIRTHKLVLNCPGNIDAVLLAQSKKFSALKRSCLEVAAVDLSIPWEIQSTKLSPHLKDWFKYLGEFVPSDNLKAHVFSRASASEAIDALRAEIEDILARRGGGESVLQPSNKVLPQLRFDLSDLDDAGVDDIGPENSGSADTDFDDLD